MHLRNVVLAILVLSAVAFCQPVTLDGSYQVRYVANLTSGVDSVVDIINTGGNGNVPANGPGFGANNGGNMCVNIYAIDPNEELLSCCSCLVTPNQVVDIKVEAGIMSNTLTGLPPTSATIKLVGSSGTGSTGAAAAPVFSASSCANEAAQVVTPAAPGATGAHQLAGGFVAWGTTVHTGAAGALVVTEAPFLPATLSASELTSLTTRCAGILGNASGSGVCPNTPQCAKGALGATKIN